MPNEVDQYNKLFEYIHGHNTNICDFWLPERLDREIDLLLQKVGFDA